MKIIARISIVTAGMALLAGAVYAQGDARSINKGDGDEFTSRDVTRYRDDKYRVICWVYTGYKNGGISCLPDAGLSEREVHP
nr:MAG TPA: hypothetical protein [Caudoviricetes sp.]